MAPIINDYAYSVQYPLDHVDLTTIVPLIKSVAFSNDGCYLYLGSSMFIFVLDLTTMKLHHKWQAHDDFVGCLDHHSSGYLASGCHDSSIAVWNTSKSHYLKWRLDGHSESVSHINFNQEGNLLVSGGHDRRLFIWSLDNGRCLRIFGASSIWAGNSLMVDQLLHDENQAMLTISTIVGSADCDLLCSMKMNCDCSLMLCEFRGNTVMFEWPSMKRVFRKKLASPSFVFHPNVPSQLFIFFQQARKLQIYDIVERKTVNVKELPSLTEDSTRELGFVTSDGTWVILCSRNGGQISSLDFIKLDRL